MERLDAAAVRAWAYASRAALAGSRDRIDAVNVFPVPDSDTGTNVLLTVTGGVEALDVGPAAEAEDVRDAMRLLARGAMRSARGNSGVIISQYLTGFAQGLPAYPDTVDVARCLAAAARAARGSMQEPQEGTILTLADAVARSAATAADAGADLASMLGSVVADAHRALAAISAEHPVLRAAHVVDAGACALLVMLDALARVVGEQPASTDALAWLPAARDERWPIDPVGGAYEVMLLVSADGDLGPTLRTAMAALGDSVAVVGGDGTWHVHVHTDDPAAAIAAAGIGVREQVLVRLVVAAHGAAARADDPRCGVVVCTSSPDLAGWYASAGAVTVVRCAEAAVTAHHLERAVTDAGTSRVAVLAGDAVADDEVARLVAAHPEVEVLDAGDELRVAVATLALATTSDAGLSAAHQALGRLRAVELDGPVTPLAVRDAAGALLRSATEPVESLTVLLRDPGELLDELAAFLAEHQLGVEPTVVGPTGRGPAVLIGLD